MAQSLSFLGQLLLRQRDVARARSLFEESLALVRELGNRIHIAQALLLLAHVAVLQSDVPTAHALYEESLALYRELDHKNGIAACHEGLEKLHAHRKMPHLSKVPRSTPTYPAELTAREVEVLRLVVQGLTNAQIAEQLVISHRTANAHVCSIYNKLDVTSRIAATRFAIDHKLI